MKILKINLNILKKNIIHKHKFCLLKKSLLTTQLLKLLLKYNMIKNFNEILFNKKKYLKIEYTYYSNALIFKKLMSYMKRKNYTLTTTKLKKLIKQNSIYILSTSKNLLSDKDCYYNNLGGVVICKIYI